MSTRRIASLALCAAAALGAASHAQAYSEAKKAPPAAAASAPKAAASQAKPASPAQPASAAHGRTQKKLVDINSASKAELMALPGIGEADADRIIKARPYPSKAKLGADKIITDPQYQAIRGLVVAAQPEPAKAKSAAKSGASTSAKP